MCETPVEVAAFEARLESAWEAALAGDRLVLRERTLALEHEIACLAGPLSPASAAAFHRVEAMEALDAGDRRAAVAAAAAAHRLGGEVATEWAARSPSFGGLSGAEAETAMIEDFGTSLAARVYTDGRANAARAVGQPLVVQIFAADGAPIAGAWVDARAPLPDWIAFPPVSCAADVPVEVLLADASRAEAAYAALDVPAFEASLQAVAAGLSCVTGRISPLHAAAVHRLEGLRQYTHGEATSAVRSFQESRALDPVYVPAEAIVPPGSSLAALWDQAGTPAATPWTPVEVPSQLRLLVDGLGSAVRPAGLPAILQLATPTGEVLSTMYVPAGASMPDLRPLAARARVLEEEAAPPALRLYRDEGLARADRLRSTGLAAAGVAALTGATAFYVANANAVEEYEDPGVPHTRLTKLQLTANRSASVSAGLLAAGVGLVGASFLF